MTQKEVCNDIGSCSQYYWRHVLRDMSKTGIRDYCLCLFLGENKYRYTTPAGDIAIYDLNTNTSETLVTAAVKVNLYVFIY